MSIPKGPSILKYIESGFLILNSIEPEFDSSGVSTEILPEASKVSINLELLFIFSFNSLIGMLLKSLVSDFDPEHEYTKMLRST